MFTPIFLIRTALVASAMLAGQVHAAEQPTEDAPAATEFVLVEHKVAGFQQVLALRTTSALEPSPPLRRSTPQAATSLARERVLPWIRSAEARHRLPLGLLDAVIAIESAYLPFAVSSAGAAGLAQLMPATATRLGVRNRFDPAQSIDGGGRYLRQMLDRFGTVSLALAAYNAGPSAVARARGIPSNRETPAYVARVISHWLTWQR